MARVVITRAASEDRNGILIDLAAQGGRRVAAKYHRLFEALYVRLEARPGSGAPRPALGSHIRIGIVSPYIIVYRHIPHDEVVTVLRIIHGRRRISGNMLG